MKYRIGVDVGGMSIKAGIVGDSFAIGAKKSIVTMPNKPSAEIVRDIAELIKSIMSENGLTPQDIDGVGLGFPGSVYDAKGVVRYCCNINLINVPIVKMLREELSIDNVKISNDANCAALAETTYGAGKGALNSVMLTLGTGLGTGIIVDGRMLTGHQSAGAEGGHMQIDMKGPVCGCGKKGCFEVYASATALIRQVKEAMEKNPDSLLHEIAKTDGLSGKTVFIAAKQGDKVAKRVIARYIKYIGAGLLNFSNIFFPEVIIIGGGVSVQGDLLIKPLQKYVAKNIYGSEYNPKIKVVAAALGNDAGIIGAALLCR